MLYELLEIKMKVCHYCSALWSILYSSLIWTQS